MLVIGGCEINYEDYTTGVHFQVPFSFLDLFSLKQPKFQGSFRSFFAELFFFFFLSFSYSTHIDRLTQIGFQVVYEYLMFETANEKFKTQGSTSGNNGAMH